MEPSPRRVRAYFADIPVADSKRVMLLFDPKYLPVYYFPKEDVRMDLLEPTDYRTHSPSKGEAVHYTIGVGERFAENELSVSHSRVSQNREPDVLLQRAGGYLPRWRAATEAKNPLVTARVLTLTANG